jgi:nucleotide-binding universal stress UspA family protein
MGTVTGSQPREDGMYSSIVVGIDGSPTAETALTKAVDLARLTGATLHVVSAYEPAHARVTGGAPAGEFSTPPDFKVDAVLQRALDRTSGADVDVQQHAPKGSAADALIAVAEAEGADLIVIGSVGMQGARRVLGSVPNKVSHHSPCDVLIVHTR